jgi:polysaccharide export outer membrane protein
MYAALRLATLLALLPLSACTHKPEAIADATSQQSLQQVADYVIAAGDQLNIFVWKNPELTVSVPVRPDGRISIPLVQDVQAAGKTSKILADDIRQALLRYVKDPVITVMVQSTQGSGGNRVVVIGAVAQPRAVPYRAGLTLLDVMVEVGGLKEYAAGNRAKLIRKSSEGVTETPVRISDLIEDGDQKANVILQPGDVISIPERWF